MKVVFRTQEMLDGADCGEMNPEQLNEFFGNIRKCGFYDGENLIRGDAWVQYCLIDGDFFAEVVVEVPDAA